MKASEVQKNLEIAIGRRKEDQRILETNLGSKINGLEKKIDIVSNDVCGVKEDVTELRKVLDQQVKKTLTDHGELMNSLDNTIKSWTPYVQESMKRSEAYKVVSADMKEKKLDWRLRFSIASLFFGTIAAILAILEFLRIIK